MATSQGAPRGYQGAEPLGWFHPRVLARTDLFTEFTTIAILPVLAREARVPALARLWALVLAGNLIGGGMFAAAAATYSLAGRSWATPLAASRSLC